MKTVFRRVNGRIIPMLKRSNAIEGAAIITASAYAGDKIAKESKLKGLTRLVAGVSLSSGIIYGASKIPRVGSSVSKMSMFMFKGRK